MIISLESMPGSDYGLISGPGVVLGPGAVWSRTQVQCGAGPECYSVPGTSRMWSWIQMLVGPGPMYDVVLDFMLVGPGYNYSVVFSLKPNCKMSQSQTFGLGLNMV